MRYNRQLLNYLRNIEELKTNKKNTKRKNGRIFLFNQRFNHTYLYLEKQGFG